MSISHQIVSKLPAPVKRALRSWNAYRQFCRYQEDEWVWAATCRKLVTPGDTIVDAGANLGYLSRIFAEWVGSTGRVYSYEPVPDTFRWLFKNVAQSGMEQITPFPHGLSDTEAKVRMEVPSYEDGVENYYESRILTDEDAAEQTVEAMVAPLDKYAGQLENLSLLKIDVEGHECSVVRGAAAVLEARKPAMLIEVTGEPGKRPETTQLWEILSAAGYAPLAFLEPVNY